MAGVPAPSRAAPGVGDGEAEDRGRRSPGGPDEGSRRDPRGPRGSRPRRARARARRAGTRAERGCGRVVRTGSRWIAPRRRWFGGGPRRTAVGASRPEPRRDGTPAPRVATPDRCAAGSHTVSMNRAMSSRPSCASRCSACSRARASMRSSRSERNRSALDSKCEYTAPLVNPAASAMASIVAPA